MARTPDAALSGSDLTNANTGATTVHTFYDVVSNVTVATARINQSTFTYPLTQITVDNTSAGWTDVTIGMDVFVGTSAGAADIGVYRVRGSTATLLAIGEIAYGEPGLIIPGIRTTGLADNQYITIVDRQSVWSVLPRIVDPDIYEDYEAGMSPTVGFNVHPAPVVSVLTSSAFTTQYNQIWTFVDDGQDYATIVFTASVDVWPTSASATYAWTVPSAFTVTAGATNTNTFTARVPSASTNYIVKLVVTANDGGIQRRRVNVWSKARTGANAPLTMDELSGITMSETDVSMSFTLHSTRLTNIPDGSMVVIAQDATFNGTRITSAVTQYVGWIARVRKTLEPGLTSADVEFISPAGLLEFKRGTSQIFDVDAAPNTWQKLLASLMSLSFAQFWLLSQRARGILELFDFVPYSTSPTGQRLPALVIDAAPLWQQLVDLADGIGKRGIGCDPDGTLWVMPHPSLLAYPRSSTVKRDALDASLYSNLEWSREMYDKVGLVEGEAFTWDGSADQPTPYLSLAPGYTPGQGPGNVKVEKQVLADQDSLNTLTGHYLRFLNPDYPEVTITIEGNRGALLKPAQRQMVRLQATAAQTPDGVALDRYIIPREVRLSYVEGEGGSIVVNTSITGPLETAGVTGTTKPVPITNDNLYGGQTIITPPVTSTNITDATHDGTTMIALTDTHVLGSVNYGINWINLTGTGLSGTFWALILDPYSDFLGASQAGNLGAWLLSTTGLYYTQNILNTSPAWVLKNALSPGVVNAIPLGTIRASTTTQGVVYVAWADNAGSRQVRTAKLTSYGVTTAWTYTSSTWNDAGVAPGMDIDHYGSDEMLVGVRDTSISKQTIYRIIAGTPTHLSGADTAQADGFAVNFIQKPLLRFGGGANSNTSSTEDFIWFGGVGILDYTTDGASTVTDISPAGWVAGVIRNSISSIAATDDGDTIAFVIPDGTLYTTSNRGGAWNSYGPDADGMTFTIGFFPRQISGAYALYMAGATKIIVSPDFGVTRNNKTGDLHTVNGGAPTYISTVIPLY